MTLTVEMILKGTGIGPMQSVGQMQVIPILGDDDATYAPPELEVGTSGYGSVALRNASDKPTIVPYGAGWVVKERAQDHVDEAGAQRLRAILIEHLGRTPAIPEQENHTHVEAFGQLLDKAVWRAILRRIVIVAIWNIVEQVFDRREPIPNVQ